MLSRLARGLARATTYLAKQVGPWLLKTAAFGVLFWYGVNLMREVAKAVALANPGWTGVLMAMAASMCITSSLGVAVWLVEPETHSRKKLIQEWVFWGLFGLYWGLEPATRSLPGGDTHHLLAGTVIVALTLCWKRYGPAGTARKTA